MARGSLLNANGCLTPVCMMVRAVESTNCELKTISGALVVLQHLRAKLLCFPAVSNTLIKLSSALAGWESFFRQQGDCIKI